MTPDQQRVIDWGHRHLSDLPWRRTRDPWAVLVSEVMAQQTQVARVVPKWAAFLDRWPDPASCAAARLGEVLELWSGLGYPRRARHLHRAAGLIVDRHGGAVPEDRDALLALPGVGPYTASAVLAFAFEHDVGVVDTNIARVLARWHGHRLTANQARAAAAAAVPDGHGWWWNQTLMHLGSTICGPREPRCDECPAEACCTWRTAGNPPPDPATGSALVSGRQAPFAGSDRQARGRLLAAVADAAVPADDVARAAGLPSDPARAERVARSLVADGLIARDADGALRLP
ncbi:MAG: A/G-specific adenine glycosylase [Acidimicrobiales bacterium]